MEDKKKLKREDIEVNTMTVSFSGKIPNQPYGAIDIGGHWNVTVKEGQDPAEVSRMTYEMIRESVTEQLRPIAKKIWETQLQPLILDLPKSKADEISSRFALINAVAIISPDVATFLSNETDKTPTEKK